ncbi:MAG: hypothetical protein C4524_09550 [Candidatus Zixiibacteriota bacterium]|nr:MAG: hypothetical protein C4524_09550 [candidate division Zixibacteria bacterium]
MPKTVAVLQPFYLPWKGYFDLLARSDEFILFEQVQYVKRSWINRNRIKTPAGPAWLTIPVQVSGRFAQSIAQTEISDPGWARRHWETLRRCYARAPYFPAWREAFEALYLDCRETSLCRVNYHFLAAVCEMLGIAARFSWSGDFRLLGEPTERLVDLCRQAGATTYLTGPRARAYLREELFREAGIALEYMDYRGYPEYPQLYPPFLHEVSIVDLIFQTGPEAAKYLQRTVSPLS